MVYNIPSMTLTFIGVECNTCDNLISGNLAVVSHVQDAALTVLEVPTSHDALTGARD